MRFRFQVGTASTTERFRCHARKCKNIINGQQRRVWVSEYVCVARSRSPWPVKDGTYTHSIFLLMIFIFSRRVPIIRWFSRAFRRNTLSILCNAFRTTRRSEDTDKGNVYESIYQLCWDECAYVLQPQRALTWGPITLNSPSFRSHHNKCFITARWMGTSWCMQKCDFIQLNLVPS